MTNIITATMTNQVKMEVTMITLNYDWTYVHKRSCNVSIGAEWMNVMRRPSRRRDPDSDIFDHIF